MNERKIESENEGRNANTGFYVYDFFGLFVIVVVDFGVGVFGSCDVLNYSDTLQWLNLSFYYDLVRNCVYVGERQKETVASSHFLFSFILNGSRYVLCIGTKMECIVVVILCVL